ncbi:N-formylglutamate amidohydrolase [Rhodococcus sp. USK13]|uniref:N-formylglutamate amidohydrolase n=1 Tax=Rhodococcus sp. USK13 TaxID=2806442 RepID=UPI001BCCD9D1|nr:N-formylglutamate amidohydrolase [Rhodococcus sp. USK13]
MSADLGRIHADSHESLPDLVAEDGAANPHSVTARARTGTNVELRIHTSTAPFDVAAEAWVPASAGTVVTVVVRTVDASTGQPRHLPPAEPNEWARAIFSTVDSTSGYFLGAVDPDTGTHRSGQFAYRLYLDTARRAIPVPSQVVTCPHYPLSSVDGQPETTVPMVD